MLGELVAAVEHREGAIRIGGQLDEARRVIAASDKGDEIIRRVVFPLATPDDFLGLPE